MPDMPQTDAAPALVPVYTYFRAEGASLDKIDTMQAAAKEFEKMKKDLCKRFGANEALFSTDNTAGGRLNITTFHYAPVFEKNVPAHWEANRQTDSDGKLQAVFAQPPAGSSDHFFLTDYAGLMQRSMRRKRLENVFGIEDMPMREMPAGNYSGSFVRESHIDRTGAAGHIRDNVTFCFGSNSACRSSDPLDAMEMMGSWYIRVPNDEKGQARFTPPDAVEVPVAEMLKIDTEERGARSDRARMASFNPGI